MTHPFLSSSPKGVSLAIWLCPRASRDGILGVHNGLLKVAITAPPVDGEANAHLIQFLAKFLSVSRKQVSLTSGQTSRRKVVLVAGGDEAAIRVTIAGELS